MRILIVTAGSRGDVAPFTGLGQRLRQAGHRVTLAAHETFADLVTGSGLEYRPLPGDPRELVRARTEATSAEQARSDTVRFLSGLGEGIVAAARHGTDMVLTALGPAPLSRLAAEALGVPSMGMYLAPSVPTGEFPLPGLPQPDPALLETAQPGPDRTANFAAGRALLERAEALYAGILPELRTRLGLPGPEDREPAGGGWPVCHGYSPAVLPRPADWPAGVEVCGYWWPARPSGWRPPAELVSFLAAGPPPVFVGFGSMAPEQGERLSEVIAEAVTRAGVRAVVQAGWAGLTAPSGTGARGPVNRAPGAGGRILTVGDLPHDWLFPRVAAVVHHAGAGTTGAGLRAGVPAVAVPVLADQPFWAHRLHALGVAPYPVPFGKITGAGLGAALAECVRDPGYRERARALARRITAEDGAGAVLARIGRRQEGV